MRRARRVSGQSLTDYVVVIGVATAVMAVGQTFVRRYAQAEVRATTDELLALTEVDASDPDPRTRGMRTQRLGVEFRRPGSGFASPVAIDANGDGEADDLRLGGDYASGSTSTVTGTEIEETAVGDGRGKMRITRHARTTTRIGKEAFQGYRHRPPDLLTRPGRWFSRDDADRPLRYGADFGGKPAAAPAQRTVGRRRGAAVILEPQ